MNKEDNMLRIRAIILVFLISLISLSIPAAADSISLVITGGGSGDSYRDAQASNEIPASFGVWREDSGKPPGKSAYELKPGIWTEETGGGLFMVNTGIDSSLTKIERLPANMIIINEENAPSIRCGELEIIRDFSGLSRAESLGSAPEEENENITIIRDNSDREARYRIYFRIVD